jgi:hypothetical protein
VAGSRAGGPRPARLCSIEIRVHSYLVKSRSIFSTRNVKQGSGDSPTPRIEKAWGPLLRRTSHQLISGER